MRTLWDMMYEDVGFTLRIAILFLLIGQMYMVFMSVKRRRDKHCMICSVLHLAMGFFLFTILYDVTYPGLVMGYDMITPVFIVPAFELPWMIYAWLELASFCVIMYFLYDERKFVRITPTNDTIKAAMDRLPLGLCFFDASGTPALTNLKMNEYARLITGVPLTDVLAFETILEHIKEEREKQTVVTCPDGRVLLFLKSEVKQNEKSFSCLTAMDVTKKYDVIFELRDKHAHLADLQRRMKEVSELSGEMFLAQEESRARASMHNQLGQVLLMNRYFLDHPEEADEDMVYLTTRQMNRFLLGEVNEEAVIGDEDTLDKAIFLAKSIGIRVDLQGMQEYDLSHAVYGILSEAIRECAANAVKHANANVLIVKFLDAGEQVLILIRNNGIPPKKSIVESGGLLTLRKQIEQNGGKMSVASHPIFTVKIWMPKQEPEIKQGN